MTSDLEVRRHSRPPIQVAGWVGKAGSDALCGSVKKCVHYIAFRTKIADTAVSDDFVSAISPLRLGCSS